MATFITKGTVIANPSDDNVGRAQFVRLVATAATSKITVSSEDSTVLGDVYLHVAGDEAIIEKAPSDKLNTSAGAVTVHAVGSPRS